MFLAVSGVVSGQTQGVNLYVPNFNNAPPNLSEFSINTTTGALTSVAGQPSTTTDSNPTEVVMTPNNKFLYLTNGNGEIDAYSVGPTGFLTVIRAQPGYAVSAPIGLAVTNNYLYVASQSSNQISVFSISPSGTLTGPLTCPACATGAGTAPSNVVVDPTGSYVYVALNGTGQIGVGTVIQTGPNAGTFSTFTIAYTGPANFHPQDIVLTPSGNALFTGDTNLLALPFGHLVYAFSVSGATLGTPTTYDDGATSLPNGLAVDPTGTYLYVANQGGGNVSEYKITGATLSLLGTAATGVQPTGATVEPTGNYLYVSNQSSGTVSSYAITQTGVNAGILTPVNTVPTGTSPYYLLAHLAPLPSATVPAASPWSLAALGILLAGLAGLLYRKAYC